MDKTLPVAHSELILGGQKSGKSRRAEALAQAWLAQSTQHQAVLIATAQPWDDEMRARIARHQADRAQRVPGMRTVEEPLQLAQAISAHSTPQTLIVVDCLTLWLTNWLMPADAPLANSSAQPSEQSSTAQNHAIVQTQASSNTSTEVLGITGIVTEEFIKNKPLAPIEHAQAAILLEAISKATGPLVLVGNEIGLGVIPLGSEVRAFVDALGLLNQRVAQVCQRVTLMAAGLPLILKDGT